jgi:hypothetical protein
MSIEIGSVSYWYFIKNIAMNIADLLDLHYL